MSKNRNNKSKRERQKGPARGKGKSVSSKRGRGAGRKKVLDLLELSLLDHIIISDSRWYSFADESVTEFGK